MNWNEIKEKYPKAYEKYAMWHNYKNPNRIIKKRECDDRDLYDFFDEQGLCITVRPWNLRLDKWLYTIWNIDEDTTLIAHPTRTEAEEKAFVKSFEILEARLCGKD